MVAVAGASVAGEMAAEGSPPQLETPVNTSRAATTGQICRETPYQSPGAGRKPELTTIILFLIWIFIPTIGTPVRRRCG